MQYQFGSGNLYGMVLSGAILVPRKFGALQDVSLDFDFNLKELYGQYQFPLAIARGQGKISGKAKAASIHGGMLNDIFFGQTLSSGQKLVAIGEAGTIPATPFQITVANGANFHEDLGVTYVATGVPLVRVTSAPIAGQYSVNSATGIYTFAAADTTLAVVIDYSYTAGASGSTITLANLLSGTTPSFVASFPIFFTQPNNVKKTFYVRLNACFSKKLGMATKIEDYMIPEFDFQACADVSNNIGTITSSE
jgi:hypothetical protein